MKGIIVMELVDTSKWSKRDFLEYSLTMQKYFFQINPILSKGKRILLHEAFGNVLDIIKIASDKQRLTMKNRKQLHILVNCCTNKSMEIANP
jgi:hypothetical protein